MTLDLMRTRAGARAALALLLLAGCTGAPSAEESPRAVEAGSRRDSQARETTAAVETGTPDNTCVMTRSAPEPIVADRATTAELRAEPTRKTAGKTVGKTARKTAMTETRTGSKPGRYETATFALG